jgi:hypothetical protein
VIASLAWPGSAGAAQPQPWSYAVSPLEITPGAQFDLAMYNASDAAQTYSFAAQSQLRFGGVENVQVGPNSPAGPIGPVCSGTVVCSVDPIITTSSPELFPTILTNISDATDSSVVVIGPGQFALIGPSGTVNEAVNGAASTASGAFGSLEGSAASLQGLLGSTSSQVGGIASSVGAGSSSSGQVGTLQRQVNTLTTDVTKLTALVNRLEPKPKPKKKKKKKKP